MKPLLKYPGGKQKELPLVGKYKPEYFERYFEPFLGGGSVYLNINVERSYVNDFSFDLINFYKFVQKQDKTFFNYLEELNRLWSVIENDNETLESFITLNNYKKYYIDSLNLKNKKIAGFEKEGVKVSQKDKDDVVLTAKKTALYMIVRDIYNGEKENIELRTAAFYFMREYCYSSMFRFSKTGKFNVPYGGRSYNLKYMTEKINYMKSKKLVDYFKNTKIYNLDFEEFLNNFELTENDFIFLDPPYDSDFSTYDQNIFDKSEQERLANYLKNTKANWMLIIKKTDFISDLYKNFNIITYDMNYMVSFKNRNEREVEHLLITNYEVK